VCVANLGVTPPFVKNCTLRPEIRRGNWCYFRVAWSDAGQEDCSGRRAADAQALCLLQARGLNVQFFTNGGVTPLQQGRRIAQPLSRQRHPTAALTEGDIDELVAFLASLTSPDYKEHGVKELARQRELSLTNRPQRDTARAFGPKPL
jgi:hypothetical protein